MKKITISKEHKLAQLIGLLKLKIATSLKDNPILYERGADKHIDAALDKIGFECNRTTTWWSVVDELFSKSYEREAALAQEYAVSMIPRSLE